jgi:hypothetical protein
MDNLNEEELENKRILDFIKSKKTDDFWKKGADDGVIGDLWLGDKSYIDFINEESAKAGIVELTEEQKVKREEQKKWEAQTTKNDIEWLKTQSENYFKNKPKKEYTPLTVSEDQYSELSSDLDSIEDKLLSCDELDEDQVANLKDKLKEFESRLREKIKPKTITIANSVHTKMKNHCALYNIKIGDWVEKVILDEIKRSPWRKSTTEDIEIEKKNIMQRYFKSREINRLVKSDKLIILPKFKFLGYSSTDNKPVYNFTGNNDEYNYAKNFRIGCKIDTLTKSEPVSVKFLEEFVEIDLDRGPMADINDSITSSLYSDSNITEDCFATDPDISKKIDALIAEAKRIKVPNNGDSDYRTEMETIEDFLKETNNMGNEWKEYRETGKMTFK